MRKWISLVLSIILTLALPVTFFVNIMSYRGPGSEYVWLILLSPAAIQLLPTLLIVSLPLLIPVFNTLYVDKKLPKFATILQLAFFSLWVLLDVLFILSFFRPEAAQFIYSCELVLVGVAIILLIAHVVHTVTQAVNRKRQGKRFLTKSSAIVGITLAILILCGLGVYWANDAPYRSRFNAVKQVMDSIEEKSIKPATGKRWEDPMYRPSEQTRGEGLAGMAKCNATVSCPYIVESWLVSMEPGKEYDFMKNLLGTNGFGSIVDSRSSCDLGTIGKTANTCVIQGSVGTLYIEINVENLDEAGSAYESSNLSLSNVAPRAWRSVIISLTRTWGN